MLRYFSRILRYSALLCVVALTLSGGVLGEAHSNHDLDVVWIKYESRKALADLAEHVDIWEVQRDRGAIVALISSREARWLNDAGYTIIAYPTSVQHPSTIPGYSCFRTIEEQYALLDNWIQQYPLLAQTTTIGHSYDGQALRVLHLTNRLTSGPKPAFFLMANIHGRELITNEIALDFSQYLLENYAIDPDVTWLLDQHSIFVLASANPDGHVKNEPGQPWVWWRKNTQPYGTCDDFNYGVDLNRNSAFMWGSASANPCSEVYQGPGPTSEPEAVAIADFIRTLFPDRRGTSFNDPAPLDTGGIFISLHSYGNLILYPWASTYAAAPNKDQFAMLASKLAAFNSYIAQPASDLYTASGTTIDFAYGELGVASLLFEIGSSTDGFYPSCTRYISIVEPNIQALLYAAKLARSPYKTAFGPDIVDMTLISSPVTLGAGVLITATVDDTQNGNQTIAAAEFTVDIPVWDGGSSVAMLATDSQYDSPIEYVTANLTTKDLATGRHIIYMRGMDIDGNWGPVSADFLDIISPTFLLEPQLARGYTIPGHTLTYTHFLTNTSPLTQTYWITGSMPLWQTTHTRSPLSLAAKASSAITVAVTVPDRDTLPSDQNQDQYTLTVTTSISPSLSQTAFITTRVLRNNVYLPSIFRDDK